MIKLINKIIIKIFPPQIAWKLKNKYRSLRSSFLPKISKRDLQKILSDQMGLKRGDTVFIHSSITKLNLGFPAEDILDMLLSVVGQEGTLLFPCWHFRSRAEDYLNSTNKIFNIRKTHSKLGFITEQARRHKDALRSLHPTNSVVAIGKHAKELTEDHHLDIYPCGEKSPFFKMMKYDAKIIGLGVSVENFTFCHCVEDVMKDTFPVKTRNDKKYDVKVIDVNGIEDNVTTLVASKNIQDRNLVRFFKKNISYSACKSFSYKHSDFFIADSIKAFDEIKNLALEGKTIYNA